GRRHAARVPLDARRAGGRSRAGGRARPAGARRVGARRDRLSSPRRGGRGLRSAALRGARGRPQLTPIDPEGWAVERRYLEDDGPAALATFLERRAASLGSLAAIEPARLTATLAHRRTGPLSPLPIPPPPAHPLPP